MKLPRPQDNEFLYSTILFKYAFLFGFFTEFKKIDKKLRHYALETYEIESMMASYLVML